MELFSPEILEAIRQNVARATGASEHLDHRGFRLLQWESLYSAEKPIELSLEHEARLKPASSESLSFLLAALLASVGERIDRVLVPDFNRFGALKLERVLRSPGAQSNDHYFDLPNSLEFISKGYTFRQRVRGSSFMTWSEGDEGLSALNLELPAVDLHSNGVTARLEFNWLDKVARTLKDATISSTSQSPVHFASELAGMDLQNLEPVLENATVRQKFLGRDEKGEAMFALNVDFVHTLSLRDGIEADFVDVDASSMHFVDQNEFEILADLSGQLMERYGLVFNFATKASRAIQEFK